MARVAWVARASGRLSALGSRAGTNGHITYGGAVEDEQGN